MRKTACVVSFYRRRNIKVKKKKEIEQPLCMKTFSIRLSGNIFLLLILRAATVKTSQVAPLFYLALVSIQERLL